MQKGTTVQVDSELELEIAQKRPLTRRSWRSGLAAWAERCSSRGTRRRPVRRRHRADSRAQQHPPPCGGALRRGSRPCTWNGRCRCMAMRLCPRAVARWGEAHALCRLPQVEVALAAGVEMIYADFSSSSSSAVEAVRTGKQIALATPRIHMPGENG